MAREFYFYLMFLISSLVSRVAWSRGIKAVLARTRNDERERERETAGSFG